MNSSAHYSSHITDCILASLPHRRWIKLRTEPDCYGASKVISERLGLPFTPRSLANWQHGWIYNIVEMKYPEVFGIPSRYPFIVATESHALTLVSHGYNAIAAGHPFVYAKSFNDTSITPISNSALFMPPHGLEYTTESWSELDIIDSLKRYIVDYDYVAACIHPASIKKNQWVDSLRRLNIPVFSGATMADSNSLLRISRLFSYFTTVFTPCIGSHVVYAALSGCNVIIIDPFCEWTPEYLQDDELFQQFPKLLEYVCWLQSETFCRKYFPFLFQHLSSSHNSFLLDWSQVELGEAAMMSCANLSKHLGWEVKAQLKDLVFRTKQKTKKFISYPRQNNENSSY